MANKKVRIEIHGFNRAEMGRGMLRPCTGQLSAAE
jgi:hypothetical protein